MQELMRSAQMIAQIQFRVLEAYCIAALWYLLLVSIWGLIQARIEATMKTFWIGRSNSER